MDTNSGCSKERLYRPKYHRQARGTHITVRKPHKVKFCTYVLTPWTAASLGFLGFFGLLFFLLRLLLFLPFLWAGWPMRRRRWLGWWRRGQDQLSSRLAGTCENGHVSRQRDIETLVNKTPEFKTVFGNKFRQNDIFNRLIICEIDDNVPCVDILNVLNKSILFHMSSYVLCYVSKGYQESCLSDKEKGETTTDPHALRRHNQAHPLWVIFFCFF